MEVVNIDRSNGELTVMGVIDLLELRKRVENITGKKVSAEILENTSPSKYHLNRKTADRKSKVVSTAVLEIPLHCRGCIQRIRKYISKIDGKTASVYINLRSHEARSDSTMFYLPGVKVVSFNWNKDVVTVSGTVDMETVAEMLRRKLRRSVEISESKEEDDEKKEGEKKDERRAADATEFNGYGNGKQLQGYRVELGQPRLFFSDENPYACSVM